jgi:single-stranded-DNA-specific exonuclease
MWASGWAAAERRRTARHRRHRAGLLLLATDAERGMELAELLEAHNKDRQNVEHAGACRGGGDAGGLGDIEKLSAIVLGSRNWHPGVIGIVASRLSRLCHRPTILVSIDENGIGKGSGRSIPGFSLVEAIETCTEHLLGGGGHAMAAGISLKRGRSTRSAWPFKRRHARP